LAIGYYLNGHNYDIVQLLSECPALLHNEMLQNKKIKTLVGLPVGKRYSKQYSSLLIDMSLLSSRLIRQWVQAFVRCWGGARAAWGVVSYKREKNFIFFAFFQFLCLHTEDYFDRLRSLR